MCRGYICVEVKGQLTGIVFSFCHVVLNIRDETQVLLDLVASSLIQWAIPASFLKCTYKLLVFSVCLISEAKHLSKYVWATCSFLLVNSFINLLILFPVPLRPGALSWNETHYSPWPLIKSDLGSAFIREGIECGHRSGEMSERL